MEYDERKKILEDYKKGMVLLDHSSIQYSNNLEVFNNANKVLKENINSIETRLGELKDQIKIGALEDFKVNNNKHMLGGVKVRIIKKYNYDEEVALEWAKLNKTCLNLNKSAFKKVIKANPLDFVTEIEEASIVVPKKIVFEGEEE